MNFAALYGNELDRELGSADRSVLFNLERRKAAINAAQLEWTERTECFQRQVPITLLHNTGEYNLETLIPNYLSLAREGVSIWVVNGTSVRYVEGRDLAVVSVERLDDQEPGWRSSAGGTPFKVYTRREAGSLMLGFYPPPSIAAGDVWIALVHAVIAPVDMVADADVPFTYTADAVTSLSPYHRALAHFGAYDLEKFRKDQGREQVQLQLFEQYIERYLGRQKPKGGSSVRFAKDYRRDARRRHTWDDDDVAVTSSGGSVSIFSLTTVEPVSPTDGLIWFEDANPTYRINAWVNGAWLVLYTVTI